MWVGVRVRVRVGECAARGGWCLVEVGRASHVSEASTMPAPVGPTHPDIPDHLPGASMVGATAWEQMGLCSQGYV